MTLPHLSRALYRELRPHVDAGAVCPAADPYVYVARAIEGAAERLASDRATFRSPARTLFRDIRWCFPLTRQARVQSLVAEWVQTVDAQLERLRRSGFDALGHPARCPVFTRRGTPCLRTPLPVNGHCPSHQHLVAGEAEMQVA